MEDFVTVKADEEAYTPMASALPQPMCGLSDVGPTPFLTKTFDMVEDPQTNQVVSWSRDRNSFIVWDLSRFSMIILPNYFKHNNFSSFIRQLNTYGFRKVYPDRWEFAHEQFLAGQRQLLKNIKRRRYPSQSSQYHHEIQACVELGRFGLEEEVDRLRRDRTLLIREVIKLRQQQETSRALVAAMEERIEAAERQQQKSMAFVARALKKPAFMQQLIEQGNPLCSGGWKRKLGDSSSSRNLLAYQEVAAEPEMEKLLSAIRNDAGSSTVVQWNQNVAVQSADNISKEAINVIWEALLNGGVVFAGVDGGEGVQSEIEVPVEELAGESCSWSHDVEDIVEEMGYLSSKT